MESKGQHDTGPSSQAQIDEKAVHSPSAETKLGEIEDLDNRNGNYKRTISPRQLHLISMGYCIGSGIFIGTGTALAKSGPGGMVVGYGIVCTCVWAVLQTLAEMTIAFPVSGNIFDYADRWVDPALAFGAGFAEWLGWTAVIGTEAVFVQVLIKFWSGDSMPAVATYAIFLAATFFLFALPTKAFAYFTSFASFVKVFLFVLLTITSIALICGAGPTGKVHTGETWRNLPVFKDGFYGISRAVLFAIWASGDQVFMGIMGGEAQSPRFSMARATNLVPWRINLIFMAAVIFTTILVPSDDERLLIGSGVTASPFVIAMVDAGIPGLPHIVNAGIIICIMSMSAEALYISSRVMRTMAHQGLLPQIMAKIDDRGRPLWAILFTSVIATVLTFINLASGGATAFNWLLSITSASYFINWIIISFTFFRFRQALKAQNDPLLTQQYAWKLPYYPWIPLWLLVCSLFFCACCIVSGVRPSGETSSFDPVNFFQFISGILVIVVFTLGFKLIMRSPWRDPATADLQTGRHTLSNEEILQLDAYYEMPQWRRVLSYFKLW